MADDPKDTLEQIRDGLADLPDRLASVLRGSHAGERAWRRPRPQPAGGDAGDEGEDPRLKDRPGGRDESGRWTGGPPDRWRATENLLGAGGAFLPGLGELAGLMAKVRHLSDALGDFRDAWRTPAAATPPPLPPQPPGPLPPPLPFGMKPEGWAVPQPPPLPAGVATPLPPPLALKPEGWQPPVPPPLPGAPAAPAPLAMHPEGWRVPETPAPAAPLMPPPLPLKPDDWRPQPFELHEAGWQVPQPATPPPAPLPEPIPVAQPAAGGPAADTLGLKPADYRPPAEPYRLAPEGRPPAAPLGLAPDGWRAPESPAPPPAPLPPALGLAPEARGEGPRVPAPETPLPPPIALKPDDYRPQPFELADPDAWRTPEVQAPAPAPLPEPVPLKPEGWRPPEPGGPLPALPPLKEVLAGQKEGWAAWHRLPGALGPLPAVAGGAGAQSPAPDAPEGGWPGPPAGPAPLPGPADWSGGGGPGAGGGQDLGGKLDKVIERLEEVKAALEEANADEEGEAPTAATKEGASGARSMWGPPPAAEEPRQGGARAGGIPPRPDRRPAKDGDGGGLIERAVERAALLFL